MPNILTSNPRLAEFVLSEAAGQLSRENIVVKQTGAVVASGTVLTLITAAGADKGKYIPYVAGAGADAILYNYLPAKTGDAKAVAFARNCEVVKSVLIGADVGAITKLAAYGIIARGRAA